MCDSLLDRTGMMSPHPSTAEPHGQPRGCADDRFGPGDILRRTDQAHAPGHLQGATDGGLRFKPGKMQSETEVSAIAKGKILRRLAGDIETVRIRKPRRIAIASRNQHLNKTSARNREAADLDVFRGGAHGRPVHWTIVTQDLLDRLLDQFRSTGEIRHLVWMLHQL